MHRFNKAARFRATVAAVLTSVLVLLAACGSSGPDDANTGDSDVVAGDPEVMASAEMQLMAALEETAEVESYVISSWVAQTMEGVPGMPDSSAVIDRNRPANVSSVTPDGSHTVVDLSAILGPVMSGGVDDLILEVWVYESDVVIDTRSFQSLVVLNPTAELGPMDPAIASINLRGDDAVDPATLITAIAGSPPPALGQLADALTDRLSDVERISDNPVTFAGSISIADQMRAMGNDPEVVSRSTAAGLALGIGVDTEVLAALYLEFFESSMAEVELQLDDEGQLAQLTMFADQSGIWELIFADDGPFAADVDADEMAASREAFADAVLASETIIEFEADPDLVLAPAPAPEVDRTYEWVSFLRSAGLL